MVICEGGGEREERSDELEGLECCVEQHQVAGVASCHPPFM